MNGCVPHLGAAPLLSASPRRGPPVAEPLASPQDTAVGTKAPKARALLSLCKDALLCQKGISGGLRKQSHLRQPLCGLSHKQPARRPAGKRGGPGQLQQACMFFSSCGFSLGLSNVSILGITTQRPLSEVSTQSDQWGIGGGCWRGGKGSPRRALGPWAPSKPVNSEGMRSPSVPQRCLGGGRGC